MDTLTHPPIAARTAENEMDDLVDTLFDLTERQLASMSPEDRATAIEKIHTIAARVPERA